MCFEDHVNLYARSQLRHLGYRHSSGHGMIMQGPSKLLEVVSQALSFPELIPHILIRKHRILDIYRQPCSQSLDGLSPPLR